MKHLNGNSTDDQQISSEKKFNQLMSEYVIMVMVVSLLICDRSLFHYYLVFLKINNSSLSTKEFVRPYQLEAATTTSDYTTIDKFKLLPDYGTSPAIVHDLIVPLETKTAVSSFLDLIFGNVQNEQESMCILLSSSDCCTESDTHDLQYLIMIVGTHLILVSIIELQSPEVCLDNITNYLMYLFTSDAVIEDIPRESCLFGPTSTSVKGMLHNLSIRKPSIASPHLDKFCRDLAQHDHSKNDNSHLGNKWSNRRDKLYWRPKAFSVLLLLVSLFSLLDVTEGQPSFSDQHNEYGDLFAEVDDLMFSDVMMRMAGCSYRHSSTTQLDMIQPMSPKLESVHFCNSANMYFNLHVCEPKKLQIQHENSGLEFRESNGSSGEQFVYMCTTALWSCPGTWLLMVIISFISDGGKSTGLSLFVLGFNMAKHDLGLQPYKSTILNNGVIDVFALYDYPTTNYPISVTDNYLDEPSCSTNAKSEKNNSNAAYTNYKPFHVAKLESKTCYMEADDGRTPKRRKALGYEYNITEINDVSRAVIPTDTIDHQVIVMASISMAVLVLALLIICNFVADERSQSNEQGNINNSILHFGNRNWNPYQLSKGSQNKSVSQIIRRLQTRSLHYKSSSNIVGFETVKELSGQLTIDTRGKQTEGFYEQLPYPVQEVEKVTNNGVMDSSRAQEPVTGVYFDINAFKQSELVV